MYRYHDTLHSVDYEAPSRIQAQLTGAAELVDPVVAVAERTRRGPVEAAPARAGTAHSLHAIRIYWGSNRTKTNLRTRRRYARCTYLPTPTHRWCGQRCHRKGVCNRPASLAGGHCALRRLRQGNVPDARRPDRSEEHTSELQSLRHLVCRL